MTYARSGETTQVQQDADSLLAGRYRLQSRLGAGAMGVVWLALDERLQRLVAVKQLWPGPADSEESRQRVMREGRIAARLRHPHVITVHDVAEHNGQPALVMEYLPSRSLAAILAERDTLRPARVARIGAQAAAALAAAHAAGIVHRDVKPGNLLVGDDGVAKIADFGISHASGDISVTREGVVAGTPAYLAPEVAQGEQPSPDSDIYSLGSTLYAAVEGTPPFGGEADNSIALLHRVAAADFPEPEQAGPLTPVLLAMLRPDPADRPTAAQVAAALESVAEGQALAPDALSPGGGRTQPVLSPGSPTVPVKPVPRAAGTRLDTPLPEPAAAPAESAPAAAKRWHRFVLPAAGILVAILAVVTMFIVLTASPRSGSSNSTTAPGAALSESALTDAVSGYYALLPGQSPSAWTRLGPGLQSQGQDSYQAYWSTVAHLTVTSSPQMTAANTVTVGIALTLKDGSSVTETHRLTLISSSPSPLINSDTVVTSQTSAAPPPPPSSVLPTTEAQQQPPQDTTTPQQGGHTRPGRGHGHGGDQG
ncbi:MAG TPA: serine/threonine-protein kinase [Amycolatopsis sp.]|nr:serine/threonine-protein kinase [Amycolatopsis sp.]